MANITPVVVEAQMLIRKPVAEAFEAFVNPELTTKFWFTKSSGMLAQGGRVRWDWEMFGVGDEVIVKELEENRRILIEWASDATLVEWSFEPRGDSATMVKISNSGFPSTADNILEQAVDAKGGYTTVLAGAKAWLEHGIQLNLIQDQYPADIK